MEEKNNERMMNKKNQHIRRKKKQKQQHRQQLILLMFLIGFMFIIIIIIELSNHIVIDSTNHDSIIYHTLRFQFQRNTNNNILFMTNHHYNDDENNDIINQIDNHNYTNDEYISLINMILMTNNDTTKHHHQNQTTNKMMIPYISNQKELNDYFNNQTTTILGFCTNWNHVNVDIWWTHHPTYEILYENNTHQCFHRIMNETKSKLFQQVYNIQFNNNNNQSNCYNNDETSSSQQRIYKYISGSGWGIDMAHVIDGMLYAIRNQVPVQIVVPNNWQYVTTNNNIHQRQNNQQQQNDYNDQQQKQHSCTSMDLECYFLPHIQCKYQPQHNSNNNNQIKFFYPWYGYDNTNETVWLLQYITRNLQWLRYESIKLSYTVQLPNNETCTTIHVRRSDVILHQQYSRQYHSINEYINAANINNSNNNIISKNILILTDDSNAISEAIALYHNQKYNLYYINRPRYKNIEGGWENHIPSNNPQYEVIVLHTIFRLIQSCHILIHSKSNIANYFYAILLLHNEFIQDYVNYYDNDNYHDIFNNNITYPFEIATSTNSTKQNNHNKKQYEWKRRYHHIDIDINKHHNLIHRIQNVKTIKISKDYLNLD